MDNQPEPLSGNDDSLDSLESTSTLVEGANGAPTSSPPDNTPATLSEKSTSSGPTRLSQLFKAINIYLLLFMLLLVLTGGLFIVAYLHGRKSPTIGNTASQSLPASTLSDLANSDATVGNANQVLNIQPSTVFSNKVLVRGALEVAGTIQAGGDLSLPGLNVNGTSSFGQVQVSRGLAVAADTVLQGQLNVQKNLSVNGSGTFNGRLSAGQLAASSLQLNGDLILTHHISAGGATPSRTSGTALGGGGTVSVSGSDTSGSVSINTGSGPAAGCFATITFSQKFDATPHVIVTPIGSAAAGLAYYVNRSTTNFSICTTSAAPGNQSFGFDYLALG